MRAPSVRGVYESLFRHNDWSIGIIHEPISIFLQSGTRPEVRWLPHPETGKYLADPFAIAKGGTLYILCEEFNYSTHKGRIVCVEITEEGHVSGPNVAIELPFHMSFPYLIEDRGEVYCVPETYRAREIALYRAQKFPYMWERVCPLIRNFAGVDPTVFRSGGFWWLACTNEDVREVTRNGHGFRDQLFIWYAQELSGPWKPHVSNPVKITSDSSRPAGTPFLHDNKLYRPTQDCSTDYGKRIVVNRITALSPSDFEEEPATMVEPFSDGLYPDGIHTLSSVGQVTLVDGKRIRFIKESFKSELIERFDIIRKNRARKSSPSLTTASDSARNHRFEGL